MSFVAAIDSAKNISSWSKSVQALASILDHIRFSLCTNTLTLLAINSSRTTNGEITFSTLFFKEFSFSTESISLEGFTPNELDFSLSSYSFIVSSKHMVVLFKNLDSSNLNYVCLRVDCHSDTPPAKRYKLLVDFLTKKLIVKKFHMNYQPVIGDLNTVASRYKEEYELGDVHQFMAETATFKLFLDMVPAATEDFSIEVKNTKILFGAYTKQVLKDREFLRQPMLTTILMSTEELMDTNLGDITVLVNFRLKDIRSFINLITSVKTDGLESEIVDQDPHFETFFKGNGDPILFEYKAPHVIVTYIQITTEDMAKPESKMEDRSVYSLQAPTIHKVEKLESSNWSLLAPSRGASVLSLRLNLEGSRAPLQQPVQRVEPEDYDNFSFSHSPQTVTYGKRASTPLEGDSAKRARDDTDYSSEEDPNQAGLGPTQHEAYKPKSLFD